MTAVDIENDPITWDMAVLGGRGTPGHAVVSGGKAGYKWDSKGGTGKSAPKSVFTGREGSTIKVTLTFSDGVRGLSAKEQRADWHNIIVPILQRSADGKSAIDFYHPAVSDEPIGIRSVVTKSIGQLKTTPKGLTTVEFELLKFEKPRRTGVGSPSGSKSNSAAGGGSTAQDKVDGEMEELTNQVKDAAGGADADLAADGLWP